MLLSIKDLYAGVEDKKILNGVNLDVNRGEVHVIMGPNGSGKSTLANVIMNTGGYTVESGKIIFKDEDITNLETDKRARMGIFMSYQAPVEIPGVTLESFIRAALTQRDGEAPGFFELRDEMDEMMDELHMDKSYKDRYVNVGFSGGERKKSEILQLLMIHPDLALLDVDAVDVVGQGIKKFTEDKEKSLIVITHHHEILKYIKADYVHVIVDGKIVTTGDDSLMDKIDKEGFQEYRR